MSLKWQKAKLGCLHENPVSGIWPHSAERERLKSRLLSLGLWPVDVGGSGNCQFRALSHHLFGDASHHQCIRQQAVMFIQKHRAMYMLSHSLSLSHTHTHKLSIL